MNSLKELATRASEWFSRRIKKVAQRGRGNNSENTESRVSIEKPKRQWSWTSLQETLILRLSHLPSFESLLRRTRTLVVPATLVAAALLADVLLSTLILPTLRAPRPGKAPAPRVVFEEPLLLSRGSYDEVVKRNPFCPGCPVPPIESLRRERRLDCSKAKPGPGNLRLIGTIVLSDPQFSVATVSDGGAEAAALRIGESFKSFGKVFDIRPNRLCLSVGDAQLQFIEIPDQPIRFGQSSSGTLAPSRFEGIKQVKENEVEISKSFLMEKIKDPQLIFQASAVPERDPSGMIVGFRILNIMPGSVYEALGFLPQDVIQKVNGDAMDSITKAQSLYSQVQNAKEVNIEILRNGQPTTIKFQVK